MSHLVKALWDELWFVNMGYTNKIWLIDWLIDFIADNHGTCSLSTAGAISCCTLDVLICTLRCLIPLLHARSRRPSHLCGWGRRVVADFSWRHAVRKGSVYFSICTSIYVLYVKCVSSWTRNFLLLNSDKTEVLLLGPKHLRHTLSNDIAVLDDIALASNETVRNLGVIFNPD